MAMAPVPSCTTAFPNVGRPFGREMNDVSSAPAIQRRYTLNEDFFEVLKDVGAVRGKPYEWKDVIMLFLRYLAKRKPSLFDPDNKSRVLCGLDPLGNVFGVQQFSKEETRLLVRQHITLVEDELPPLPPLGAGPSAPPDPEPGKRGPGDAAADDPDSKRSRTEEGTAGAGPGPSDAAAPPPPAPLHRADTLGETDAPRAA